MGVLQLFKSNCVLSIILIIVSFSSLTGGNFQVDIQT